MMRVALLSLAALSIGGPMQIRMVATSAASAPADEASDSSAPVKWASITTGEHHTCALTAAGSAYCWGDHIEGQLGRNLQGERHSTKPVAVSGGHVFVAISAGIDHTCAITTASIAYCWGDNDFGMLGDGTEKGGWNPIAVVGGLKFAVVSAGESHTCGVTTTGDAYCWGWNANGRIGNGVDDMLSSTRPVRVSGGLRFATVTTGAEHTCALTTEGAAYCWGNNANLALGVGRGKNTPDLSTTPLPVAGGLKFAALSAGLHRTCGITTDGAAYCWGYPPLVTKLGMVIDYPVAVPGTQRFVAISVGGGDVCGVTTAGTLYCFGGNEGWRFGIGDVTEVDEPIASMVGLRFTAVSLAAGPTGIHACGITPEGAAYCAGGNVRGELGVGSNEEGFKKPVKVLDP